jgi:SAM-dependent methyltransferase
MRDELIADGSIESTVPPAGRRLSPILEGYGMANTQALLVAARIGLFEALEPKPLSAADVASDCDTDQFATEKLCNLLVGMDYLDVDQSGMYRLSDDARRRLTGPDSVIDSLLMKELEWRWLAGLEAFVRDGSRGDAHDSMSSDDWQLYQRGMRSNAGVIAPLVARRMPVPDGAAEMLDLGGSHGYYSVAICRRHKALRATVLDLPQAVEHARPLLEAEGMGDRVTMKTGNALHDELGTDAFDIVFLGYLVHHFEDAANRELMKRAARALRPGGVVVIFEATRVPPGKTDEVGSFFDLYFALTSRAGLYTFDEMAGWQRDAGLTPRKPILLPRSRANGLQVGDKLA